VVSDVCGKFDSLFARINTIAAQHGQFTMLLCIGKFLGGSIESLKPYIANEKQVPLPLFFITTTDEEALIASHMGKFGQVCNNCVYLGKSGLREINGLQVGYFGGGSLASTEMPSTSLAAAAIASTRNEQDWTEEDVNSLLQRASTTLHFRGIDILLTNHWPRGLFSELASVFLRLPYTYYNLITWLLLNRELNPPQGISLLECDTYGSDVVAKISSKLVPRYHVR